MKPTGVPPLSDGSTGQDQFVDKSSVIPYYSIPFLIPGFLPYCPFTHGRSGFLGPVEMETFQTISGSRSRATRVVPRYRRVDGNPSVGTYFTLLFVLLWPELLGVRSIYAGVNQINPGIPSRPADLRPASESGTRPLPKRPQHPA